MRRSFVLLAFVALLSLSAVALADSLDESGMELLPPADLSRFSVKPVIEDVLLESGSVSHLEAEASVEQFPGSGVLDRAGQIGQNMVAAFDAWRRRFAKKYKLGELAQRLAIFAANVRRIASLNARGGAGEYTAEGPFTDLTEAEFRATMLKARPPTQSAPNFPSFLETGADFEAHEDDVLFEMSAENRAAVESSIIDYRNLSTPIKNQGNCGSCWAFSAVTTLEYAAAKAGKGVQAMSVQHLMDCDNKGGQKACDGGDQLSAFKFYYVNGAVPESTYTKYIAKQGNCTIQSGKGPKVRNFGLVIPQCKIGKCLNQVKHEPLMIQALKTHGPLSVSMNANSLQFWKKGILEPSAGCSADWDSLNHAMVIVGYNPTEKTWLIRNSWGASWGEKGYFRLAYGQNTCGVADFVTAVAV